MGGMKCFSCSQCGCVSYIYLYIHSIYQILLSRPTDRSALQSLLKTHRPASSLVQGLSVPYHQSKNPVGEGVFVAECGQGQGSWCHNILLMTVVQVVHRQRNFHVKCLLKRITHDVPESRSLEYAVSNAENEVELSESLRTQTVLNSNQYKALI